MFRKIKYWYLVLGFPLLIGGAMLLGVFQDCRALPDADRQLQVYSARGFEESIKTGMGYLNRAAGCTILVPGSPDTYDIQFIAMTATPCAVDPFHPGIESGHSANAYQCPKVGTWDIDVEAPGDTHSMVYISMHEILHTLGMEDSEHGIMGNNYKPDGRIWPNDKETAYLKTLCD